MKRLRMHHLAIMMLVLVAGNAAAPPRQAGTNEEAIDAYVRQRMAARRLRGRALTHRDGVAFLLMAALDITLIAYFLLVQLPENLTTVPLMLRLAPDLGLMLVIVLILTAGWGAIRSLWALRRRRELARA